MKTINNPEGLALHIDYECESLKSQLLETTERYMQSKSDIDYGAMLWVKHRLEVYEYLQKKYVVEL